MVPTHLIIQCTTARAKAAKVKLQFSQKETDIHKEQARLAEQEKISEAASQRRQAELNATLTLY